MKAVVAQFILTLILLSEVLGESAPFWADPTRGQDVPLPLDKTLFGPVSLGSSIQWSTPTHDDRINVFKSSFNIPLDDSRSQSSVLALTVAVSSTDLGNEERCLSSSRTAFGVLLSSPAVLVAAGSGEVPQVTRERLEFSAPSQSTGHAHWSPENGICTISSVLLIPPCSSLGVAGEWSLSIDGSSLPHGSWSWTMSPTLIDVHDVHEPSLSYSPIPVSQSFPLTIAAVAINIGPSSTCPPSVQWSLESSSTTPKSSTAVWADLNEPILSDMGMTTCGLARRSPDIDDAPELPLSTSLAVQIVSIPEAQSTAMGSPVLKNHVPEGDEPTVRPLSIVDQNPVLDNVPSDQDTVRANHHSISGPRHLVQDGVLVVEIVHDGIGTNILSVFADGTTSASACGGSDRALNLGSPLVTLSTTDRSTKLIMYPSINSGNRDDSSDVHMHVLVVGGAGYFIRAQVIPHPTHGVIHDHNSSPFVLSSANAGSLIVVAPQGGFPTSSVVGVAIDVPPGVISSGDEVWVDGQVVSKTESTRTGLSAAAAFVWPWSTSPILRDSSDVRTAHGALSGGQSAEWVIDHCHGGAVMASHLVSNWAPSQAPIASVCGESRLRMPLGEVDGASGVEAVLYLAISPQASAVVLRLNDGLDPNRGGSGSHSVIVGAGQSLRVSAWVNGLDEGHQRVPRLHLAGVLAPEGDEPLLADLPWFRWTQKLSITAPDKGSIISHVHGLQEGTWLITEWWEHSSGTMIPTPSNPSNQTHLTFDGNSGWTNGVTISSDGLKLTVEVPQVADGTVNPSLTTVTMRVTDGDTIIASVPGQSVTCPFFFECSLMVPSTCLDRFQVDLSLVGGSNPSSTINLLVESKNLDDLNTDFSSVNVGAALQVDWWERVTFDPVPDDECASLTALEFTLPSAAAFAGMPTGQGYVVPVFGQCEEVFGLFSALDWSLSCFVDAGSSCQTTGGVSSLDRWSRMPRNLREGIIGWLVWIEGPRSLVDGREILSSVSGVPEAESGAPCVPAVPFLWEDTPSAGMCTFPQGTELVNQGPALALAGQIDDDDAQNSQVWQQYLADLTERIFTRALLSGDESHREEAVSVVCGWMLPQCGIEGSGWGVSELCSGSCERVLAGLGVSDESARVDLCGELSGDAGPCLPDRVEEEPTSGLCRLDVDVVCEPGSGPGVDGVGCVRCQAGTFSAGGLECLPCPDGTSSGVGATSCAEGGLPDWVPLAAGGAAALLVAGAVVWTGNRLVAAGRRRGSATKADVEKAWKNVLLAIEDDEPVETGVAWSKYEELASRVVEDEEKGGEEGNEGGILLGVLRGSKSEGVIAAWDDGSQNVLRWMVDDPLGIGWVDAVDPHWDDFPEFEAWLMSLDAAPPAYEDATAPEANLAFEDQPHRSVAREAGLPDGTLVRASGAAGSSSNSPDEFQGLHIIEGGFLKPFPNQTSLELFYGGAPRPEVRLISPELFSMLPKNIAMPSAPTNEWNGNSSPDLEHGTVVRNSLSGRLFVIHRGFKRGFGSAAQEEWNGLSASQRDGLGVVDLSPKVLRGIAEGPVMEDSPPDGTIVTTKSEYKAGGARWKIEGGRKRKYATWRVYVGYKPEEASVEVLSESGLAQLIEGPMILPGPGSVIRAEEGELEGHVWVVSEDGLRRREFAPIVVFRVMNEGKLPDDAPGLVQDHAGWVVEAFEEGLPVLEGRLIAEDRPDAPIYTMYEGWLRPFANGRVLSAYQRNEWPASEKVKTFPLEVFSLLEKYKGVAMLPTAPAGFAIRVRGSESDGIYMSDGAERRLFVNDLIFRQYHPDGGVQVWPEETVDVMPEGRIMLPMDKTLIRLEGPHGQVPGLMDGEEQLWIIEGESLDDSREVLRRPFLNMAVFRQRHPNAAVSDVYSVMPVPQRVLDELPAGEWVLPNDETLLTVTDGPEGLDGSVQVYKVDEASGSLLRYLNHAVLDQREGKSVNVGELMVVPEKILELLPAGEWVLPKDGTLLTVTGGPEGLDGSDQVYKVEEDGTLLLQYLSNDVLLQREGRDSVMVVPSQLLREVSRSTWVLPRDGTVLFLDSGPHGLMERGLLRPFHAPNDHDFFYGSRNLETMTMISAQLLVIPTGTQHPRTPFVNTVLKSRDRSGPKGLWLVVQGEGGRLMRREYAGRSVWKYQRPKPGNGRVLAVETLVMDALSTDSSKVLPTSGSVIRKAGTGVDGQHWLVDGATRRPFLNKKSIVRHWEAETKKERVEELKKQAPPRVEEHDADVVDALTIGRSLDYNEKALVGHLYYGDGNEVWKIEKVDGVTVKRWVPDLVRKVNPELYEGVERVPDYALLEVKLGEPIVLENGVEVVRGSQSWIVIDGVLRERFYYPLVSKVVTKFLRAIQSGEKDKEDLGPTEQKQVATALAYNQGLYLVPPMLTLKKPTMSYVLSNPRSGAAEDDPALGFMKFGPPEPPPQDVIVKAGSTFYLIQKDGFVRPFLGNEELLNEWLLWKPELAMCGVDERLVAEVAGGRGLPRGPAPPLVREFIPDPSKKKVKIPKPSLQASLGLTGGFSVDWQSGTIKTPNPWLNEQGGKASAASKDGGKQLSQAGKDAGKWLSDTSKDAQDTLEKFVDDVAEVAGDAWRQVLVAAKDVAEIAEGAAAAIAEIADGVWMEIVKIGDDLVGVVGKIIDYVEEKVGDLAKGAKKLIEEGLEVIEDVGGEIAKAGKDFSDDVVTALESIDPADVVAAVRVIAYFIPGGAAVNIATGIASTLETLHNAITSIKKALSLFDKVQKVVESVKTGGTSGTIELLEVAGADPRLIEVINLAANARPGDPVGLVVDLLIIACNSREIDPETRSRLSMAVELLDMIKSKQFSAEIVLPMIPQQFRAMGLAGTEVFGWAEDILRKLAEGDELGAMIDVVGLLLVLTPLQDVPKSLQDRLLAGVAGEKVRPLTLRDMASLIPGISIPGDQAVDALLNLYRKVSSLSENPEIGALIALMLDLPEASEGIVELLRSLGIEVSSDVLDGLDVEVTILEWVDGFVDFGDLEATFDGTTYRIDPQKRLEGGVEALLSGVALDLLEDGVVNELGALQDGMRESLKQWLLDLGAEVILPAIIESAFPEVKLMPSALKREVYSEVSPAVRKALEQLVDKLT